MFKTKTKTLSDIVAGFNTMVSDLEALARRNFDEADKRSEDARALQAEAEALQAEADEALKVSANVAALMGR